MKSLPRPNEASQIKEKTNQRARTKRRGRLRIRVKVRLLQRIFTSPLQGPSDEQTITKLVGKSPEKEGSHQRRDGSKGLNSGSAAKPRAGKTAKRHRPEDVKIEKKLSKSEQKKEEKISGKRLERVQLFFSVSRGLRRLGGGCGGGGSQNEGKKMGILRRRIFVHRGSYPASKTQAFSNWGGGAH